MRGIGYGIEAIRIDGNDLFAVYNVVKHYRKRCLEENRPFLIEAMTYRVGHHSTSDDWKAYRPEFEVKNFGHENCPISRVKQYLYNHEIWTSDNETKLYKEVFI